MYVSRRSASTFTAILLLRCDNCTSNSIKIVHHRSGERRVLDKTLKTDDEPRHDSAIRDGPLGHLRGRSRRTIILSTATQFYQLQPYLLQKMGRFLVMKNGGLAASHRSKCHPPLSKVPPHSTDQELAKQRNAAREAKSTIKISCLHPFSHK